MLICPFPDQVSPININDGDRSERVDLSRCGPHGGREDHADHQSDQAYRQIRFRKRQENIIRVVELPSPCPFANGLKRLLAALIKGALSTAEFCQTFLIDGRVSSRFRELESSATTRCKGLFVLLFNGRPPGPLLNANCFPGVVDGWALDKERKDKNYGADEQDEELHRDLENRSKQKTQAALRNRFSRKVSLHLTLVAA